MSGGVGISSEGFLRGETVAYFDSSIESLEHCSSIILKISRAFSISRICCAESDCGFVLGQWPARVSLTGVTFSCKNTLCIDFSSFSVVVYKARALLVALQSSSSYQDVFASLDLA